MRYTGTHTLQQPWGISGQAEWKKSGGPKSYLPHRQQHTSREPGQPHTQTTNGPEPSLRVPQEQLEGNRICRFIDCG